MNIIIIRIYSFLRRLFASLIWFAAAPKDWDSELGKFEVKIEKGYLVQKQMGKPTVREKRIDVTDG